MQSCSSCLICQSVVFNIHYHTDPARVGFITRTPIISEELLLQISHILRDIGTKTLQQEGKNTTLMEFLLWICDNDETNNTALSHFTLSLLRSE